MKKLLPRKPYRNCIQIGLGTTAEYAYLAAPDWQDQMQKVKHLKDLPPELCTDDKRWQYYGIDVTIGSISYCIEKYSVLPEEHLKHITWICTRISEEQALIRTSHYRFESPFKRSPKIFRDQHARLGVVGISFDELIESLEFDDIDVLAVDIEGAEIALFEDYSWRIKPKFIAVEYHDDLTHTKGIPTDIDFSEREAELGKEFQQLIEAQGYTVYRREPTNFRGEKFAKTMELQFLRSDLCG